MNRTACRSAMWHVPAGPFRPLVARGGGRPGASGL